MKLSVIFVPLAFAAACTDAPPVARGTNHHYAITAQQIPTSVLDARALALDLDGNGRRENSLGVAFATINGQRLGDVQAATNALLANGELVNTIDVQVEDFENRQYGSFSVNGDESVLGVVDVGATVTEPGNITVELGMFGEPLAIELRHARLALNMSSDRIFGTIGGGVTREDIDQQLIPSFQRTAAALVERDCGQPIETKCGCGVNSSGALAISLFANGDCDVSVNDMTTSNLVNSVVAPDVVLDGEKLTSLAFGFSGQRVGTRPHADLTAEPSERSR